MAFRLCSGERSASSAGGSVGFLLGFNFAERRVFAMSEEGDGCENNFFEEADVKPNTVGETLVDLPPTSMFLGFGHVQSYQIRPNCPPKQVLHERAAAEWEAQPPVPCSKVRGRVGRATYPDGIAERVLTMKRLGGGSTVAQIVADNPLKLFEANGSKLAKLQVWEKIWSNDGTWRKMAKRTEEDIGTAMKFLQSKVLCTMMPVSLAASSESSTLRPPEPNAPL